MRNRAATGNQSSRRPLRQLGAKMRPGQSRNAVNASDVFNVTGRVDQNQLDIIKIFVAGRAQPRRPIRPKPLMAMLRVIQRRKVFAEFSLGDGQTT